MAFRLAQRAPATDYFTATGNESHAGDVIGIDITEEPAGLANPVRAYEAELVENGTTTTTHRLMGGNALNYKRRLMVNPGSSYTVRVRPRMAVNQDDVIGSEVLGSWSTAQNVTPTTRATSVTIAPTVTGRTSIPQNAGIQLEATAEGFSTDDPWRMLRYKWVSDENVALQQMDANQPWGTATDVCYGPLATFVFTTSGTHTVTCYVTDGVQGTTNTFNVTVTDNDVTYAGANTICINAAGTPDAAYPSSQGATSLADALTKIGSRTDIRLAIDRGQTNMACANLNATLNTLVIEAYGTGNLPHFKDSANLLQIQNVSDEIVVGDFHNEGGYNIFTAAMDGGFSYSRNGFTATGGNNAGAHVTVRNVVTEKFFENFACGDDGLAGCVMFDTLSKDWISYGGMIEGDPCPLGWVGYVAEITSDPYVGDDGKTSGSNYILGDHNGPMRASRPAGGLSFHNCVAVGLHEWSNTSSINRNFRFFQGPSTWAGRVSIERVVDIGQGFLSETNAPDEVHGIRIVIDKYAAQGLYDSVQIAGVNQGIVARNFLLMLPDTPPWSTQTLDKFLSSGWTNGRKHIVDAYGAPMRFYNGTVAMLRTDSTFNGTNGDAKTYDPADIQSTGANQSVLDVGNYNMAHHVPNLSVGRGQQTADGPFDTTTMPGHRYGGIRRPLTWRVRLTNCSNSLYSAKGEASDAVTFSGGATGFIYGKISDEILISGSLAGGTGVCDVLVSISNNPTNKGNIPWSYTGTAPATSETLTYDSGSVLLGTVSQLEDPSTGVTPGDAWAVQVADHVLFRPQLAAGCVDDVTTTDYVAIDDFYGDIRPGMYDPETASVYLPGTTAARGHAEPVRP